MSNHIPFLDLKQLNAPYEREISDAVSRVALSGRYIGGPEVEAFENELARYQHSPHVVGVSNGLDALRLIMQGYIQMGQLSPGDEVIVPANTYIASILAISHARLKPVLVEPDPKTLNLDTSLIESAITPLTRAIMVVHLYGRVCWDERLVDIARRHNLLVIEDNAQGIGSRATVAGLHGGYMAGSLGHAAAFSFYPTKNLGAMGDAGAIATNDTDLASTVRALANYGSDRRYHNIYQGHNCRLDPIQAAVLRIKLRGLDADNNRRRHLASLYAQLVDSPSVKLCLANPDVTTNYHQFIALCDNRDDFRTHLHNAGIDTDIHYAVPPHLQPCYAAEFANCNLPVTETLARRIVSLPIAPYLTDAHIHTIAEAINTLRAQP